MVKRSALTSGRVQLERWKKKREEERTARDSLVSRAKRNPRAMQEPAVGWFM